MKQIKILLALISIGLLFNLVSCTKEKVDNLPVVENQNELIKEYYAPDGVDVKAKILSFLTKTETFNLESNQQRLADFEDTEVNAAMWLMEGASNYLSNANLGNEADPDNEVLTYSITVANTVDGNGDIAMVGSNMITQFNQLHNNINTTANTNNKVAMLIDYELIGLNTNQSEIGVKAILSESAQNSNNGPQVPNFVSSATPCQQVEFFESGLGNIIAGNATGGYTVEAYGSSLALEIETQVDQYFDYDGMFLTNITFQDSFYNFYGPGDHWLSTTEVSNISFSAIEQLTLQMCERLKNQNTTAVIEDAYIFANSTFVFDQTAGTDYGFLFLDEIAYGIPYYY